MATVWMRHIFDCALVALGNVYWLLQRLLSLITKSWL